MQTCEYGQTVEITDGVTAEFIDAGHLLGSASIRLTCREGGETRTIVFSGTSATWISPLSATLSSSTGRTMFSWSQPTATAITPEVWSYTDELGSDHRWTIAKGR